MFLLIPGIVLAIYLTFSNYFLVIDNKKGLRALTTSKYYVEVDAWGVFWRLLGPVLIILIAFGGDTCESVNGFNNPPKSELRNKLDIIL